MLAKKIFYFAFLSFAVVFSGYTFFEVFVGNNFPRLIATYTFFVNKATLILR